MKINRISFQFISLLLYYWARHFDEKSAVLSLHKLKLDANNSLIFFCFCFLFEFDISHRHIKRGSVHSQCSDSFAAEVDTSHNTNKLANKYYKLETLKWETQIGNRWMQMRWYNNNLAGKVENNSKCTI